MTGSFATIQAAYAAHDVATYPLTADKTPAVKHWGRIGTLSSAQLALRFADETAAGFNAGRRNRITVVDIDSTDEKLRDEIQARYGVTPLWVQTPSGGLHGYYRHNGELRRIRPFPDVDILGAGNVVCAGSKTPKGRYEIERGSLADLDRLPPLRAAVPPTVRPEKLPIGQRNKTMFRWALRLASQCADFNAVLAELRDINLDCCHPPLPDTEVMEIARSAWSYEASGKNWVGRKARATTNRDELLAFAHDPAAHLLLNLLRSSHPIPGATFAISQPEVAKLLGWDRGRVSARIGTLIAMKYLKRIHRGRGRVRLRRAIGGDPHLYALIRVLEKPAQYNQTPSP